MKDKYGRTIEYLRLSVTERCNLKCVYCRPGGECPKSKELSPESLERIARAFARLGGNKLRVTGGEPLMRRDLEEIIRRIGDIGAYGDICMTTNGHGLDKRIQDLKQAGLKRLNISLDSLKPEKYAALTGGGNIAEVFTGIDKALELDLTPIKINAVVVRGENENEIDDFIQLAKNRPIEVRFIELMPIGKFGEKAARSVPSEELIVSRPFLKALPRRLSQPSADYKIEGYVGRIGFISAMSHQFCEDCNRIRITSDGKIKICLGDNAETSLLPALEQDDETLEAVMREVIYNKCKGHNFQRGFASVRSMDRIGG